MLCRGGANTIAQPVAFTYYASPLRGIRFQKIQILSGFFRIFLDRDHWPDIYVKIVNNAVTAVLYVDDKLNPGRCYVYTIYVYKCLLPEPILASLPG